MHPVKPAQAFTVILVVGMYAEQTVASELCSRAKCAQRETYELKRSGNELSVLGGKLLLKSIMLYVTISEKSNAKDAYYIMEIYEKIFNRLEELHITQLELSRRTGIATSTICDWKKKKINPQSDKLVSICKALEMSLVDLLCSEDSSDSEKRILRYYDLLSYYGETATNNKLINNRKVSIITDENGNQIVLVNDKKFKGISKDDWKEVEKYLMQYVGEYFEIACCAEKVFIDTDFPDEYSNSESRLALKGPRRVAKANASQAIPELIQIATPTINSWEENKEKKHSVDAKNGWYRYNVRFGIPVYDNDGELERYNIFTAIMLVRHDEDGKKYLYDLTTIKKETSGPLES